MLTMLTFSVLWLIFAAAITVAAMVKRSAGDTPAVQDAQTKDFGDALVIVAVLSTLMLFAGFLYIGNSLISAL